ncbi:RNA polymerase subunit sigma-70 [Fictibacillus fluitans]|uniref:RNA polymerase subunit sigma-70 n=1 Tax=Fictibacillus fluitans TaxID=3058422 RepID=A0ABT8HZR9_9BACL|nr:RNA polymerase subunit sigma-70 [Fictibacillus sp. NE201]MDN4526269.1 RNA polymerase subunit sigma-70 [Fictibacillus sp. NE201]
MHNGEKGEQVNVPVNQLMGIDFHDFIQKEASSSNMELAEEFGVPLRSVISLRKKMSR